MHPQSFRLIEKLLIQVALWDKTNQPLGVSIKHATWAVCKKCMYDDGWPYCFTLSGSQVRWKLIFWHIWRRNWYCRKLVWTCLFANLFEAVCCSYDLSLFPRVFGKFSRYFMKLLLAKCPMVQESFLWLRELCLDTLVTTFCCRVLTVTSVKHKLFQSIPKAILKHYCMWCYFLICENPNFQVWIQICFKYLVFWLHMSLLIALNFVSFYLRV